MSQTKAQLIDPVDGTIVNADINASAAIAGSKISPDFGSQNIVTTGSVGIGIGSQTPSTPQKQLHIAHDSSPRIMLSNDTTGHATPNGTELLLDSGGNFEILQRENLNIEFFTNNSQRMTINGSGNIGIGTTSPTGALTIASGTFQTTTPTSTGDDIVISGNQSLGIQLLTLASNTSNNNIFFGDTDDPDVGRLHYAHADNSMRFRTNGSEKMQIDSSGRVLIGTTTVGESTADDLTIATSGSTGITIRGGTSDASNILFADGTSGDDAQRGIIQYHHSDDTMRFFTNATRRMTINSSGNVGIGTTSPTSALNVAGRLDVDGLQNQNTAELFANSTSGQSFGLLVNAGSTSGDYCANFRDKDAGAIMILRGDGDIGIGTSTPNRTIEIKKSSPGIRLEELTSGGNKRLELFMDGSEANIAAPQSSQTIMFSVSGADTMRLARSGSHAEMFLNCNETFTSAVLSLQTNGTCGIGLKTGATNTQKHISFRNPNGEVGQIVTGSNSTTYDTTSDYRLKENEVAISDGITRLKTLKPYKFNFKNTPSEILDGFYAHEVMTVVPQAVNGEKDEVDSNGDPKYQGIDHSMIVPLIVAAVKELITKVESLEAA